MHRFDIVIVTPALADANNGNWQTARRWSRMLGAVYRVRLVSTWSGGDEALMIALHARRSAPSVTSWHAQHPKRPCVVVLTGTDLYRDIETDPAAQRSLRIATHLVVLNELGAQSLPQALRTKVRVILQSCSARQLRKKSQRHLRALMVGHLRDEKSPETYFDAIRHLANRGDLLFDHVGAPLDPALGERASLLMAQDAHYRWLGALTHAATRARIQAAHVLVHPSRMEGGAHVVLEAVRSGTPVLASRIDGNVGLLGKHYSGYFPVGDSAALAALIARVRDDPAILTQLKEQCADRAPLFTPERERDGLFSLVSASLEPPNSIGDHP